MMIIVDTGFWVGLANRRDQNHTNDSAVPLTTAPNL